MIENDFKTLNILMRNSNFCSSPRHHHFDVHPIHLTCTRFNVHTAAKAARHQTNIIWTAIHGELWRFVDCRITFTSDVIFYVSLIRLSDVGFMTVYAMSQRQEQTSFLITEYWRFKKYWSLHVIDQRSVLCYYFIFSFSAIKIPRAIIIIIFFTLGRYVPEGVLKLR